ncbi:MAG: hypothetical protein ACKO3R_03100 [bacterium]
MLEKLSSPAELNAQALTKFFLYQLPSRLTQNAIFNNESTDPELTEMKRKICSAAVLAVFSNNSTNEAVNKIALQKFKYSLQGKFKNVTDLGGAKEALKDFFKEYPNNQKVFNNLDKKAADDFKNFKASTYDVFDSPLTSLPTLLAQALRYSIPDGTDTQNNKETLIKTIKSWQKILQNTLAALNKPQQEV